MSFLSRKKNPFENTSYEHLLKFSSKAKKDGPNQPTHGPQAGIRDFKIQRRDRNENVA